VAFPTKVQLINRRASQQWYINFPSALAQAMEFSQGETVEWLVEDKSLLALRRPHAPAPVLKKTPRPDSSKRSTNSGEKESPSTPKTASTNAPKPSP
jgi:hypothetical protein